MLPKRPEPLGSDNKKSGSRVQKDNCAANGLVSLRVCIYNNDSCQRSNMQVWSESPDGLHLPCANSVPRAVLAQKSRFFRGETKQSLLQKHSECPLVCNLFRPQYFHARPPPTARTSHVHLINLPIGKLQITCGGKTFHHRRWDCI